MVRLWPGLKASDDDKVLMAVIEAFDFSFMSERP